MAKRIQAVLLVRLFISQKAKSFSFDDENFFVQAGINTQRLKLDAVKLAQSLAWFGLRNLALAHSRGPFILRGLKSEETQSFIADLTVAVRRYKFHTQLRQRWDTIQQVYDSWSSMLIADHYISHSEREQWLAHNTKIELPAESDANLLTTLTPLQQKVLQTLKTIQGNEQRHIDERNVLFAELECKRFQDLFDRVEKHPLTDQQKEAIVHDEDNSLVIAGAGSGKTSTIIAKVGYLLKRGLARPDQILMLAYTKKAADEMRERIKKRFAEHIEVRTFHSLGMKIMKVATGKTPSPSNTANDSKAKLVAIKDLVNTLASNAAYFAKLCQFVVPLEKAYRSMWDFQTESEYRNYLLDVEPRALNGQLTASYEECEIANWLLLHGIQYRYEAAYEVDTATEERRQYKPDFYLPDYGIYIEHWGLNHAGRAAPFMDNDRYQDRIRWARKTHREQGTILVETYSWERMDGVLLTNLEEKLKARGVELGQLSMERALETLREMGVVDPFDKLAAAFLSLFKSGGYTFPALRVKAKGMPNPDRLLLFLDLFSNIYDAYERHLQQAGEIDFDDMIGGAREYVLSSAYKSPFRYIIIDEFQDMGHGRAELIKALRDQVPGCKLFCVGDDWQSIYRFAGSDITLMTKFDKHFGFTKTTPLSLTFRFNNQIAWFSTRFVLKNPSQMKKNLTTQTTSSQAEILLHMSGKKEDRIPEILGNIAAGGPASVFILNRYNSPADSAVIDAYRRKFPMLQIEAHTIHKSKGLEADYVIINNLCGGRYGFPSGISDDAVLNMVLAEPDQFEHGEERRLFYVAVTRARKQLHLVAHSDNESPFVREILTDQGEARDGLSRPPRTHTCPGCLRGLIKRRESPTGIFYGCSNYPICNYLDKACPQCKSGYLQRNKDGTAKCDTCGHAERICPKCGKGILVKRNRGYDGAEFYGCSMYGRENDSCQFIENIPA